LNPWNASANALPNWLQVDIKLMACIAEPKKH